MSSSQYFKKQYPSPYKLYSIRESLLVFLSAIYFVLFTNQHMLGFIFRMDYGGSVHGLFFKLTTVALAISLMHIVFLIFFALNLTRPMLIFLVVVAGASDFFMDQYKVLMDSVVIASVFETTQGEAGQYLSFSYFIHLLLFSLIFIVVILLGNIIKPQWQKRLWMALKYFIFNLGFIAILAAVSYKDYASFFRNNRQVRHMFNPINSLYETYRYFESKYFPKHSVFVKIGEDARLKNPPKDKKRFVVFILGETARADHFSLNNYAKETNPALKKENAMSLYNVSSCGTATATSVPCLFSNLKREGFDEDLAKSRENLLDVAQRAGYHTTWIDNNTGCKGVCARVNVIELNQFWTDDKCKDGLCFDEVLLKPLSQLASSASGDQFVVLHMIGSHGPSYYMRYPPEFSVFKPECRTNELIECTQEQVVNTYDNTLLYTDHVLGEVIAILKGIKDNYDTAMVYVSDHGESLGENGIYLHSLPYALAPEEQKKVPFFIWLSDSYQANSGLGPARLKSHQKCSVSHDYVFHSMITLLGIETGEYNSNLDIFDERECL